MKKLIIIYLTQVFLIGTIYSQQLTNLNLSNYCCPFNISDPFVGGNCCSPEWAPSHGTPNVTTGNAIVVGAGSNIAGGEPGSEGVLYTYDFIEGHVYSLTMTTMTIENVGDGKIDEVFVKLTNGLTPIAPPLPPGPRSWQTVTPTSSMDLFRRTNYKQLTPDNFDLCFIPDRDYSHLWISLNDNAQGGAPGSGVGFLVSNLSITVCEDFKVYNSTERAIFPGETDPEHNRLPVFTGVHDYIDADANDGDIIIKSDEQVTFRAGNEILITPSNNGSFIVEPPNAASSNPGFYYAYIAPCEGYDECLNYRKAGDPVGTNVGGFEYIYVPNVFDPSGNNGPTVSNFTIYYGPNEYSRPYNATKATFRIFSRAGALVHEQIVGGEDNCFEIEPGSLFWDGCIKGKSALIGVHAWTLKLENCNDNYNSKLFSGDVLVWANANCGGNFAEQEKEAFARQDREYSINLDGSTSEFDQVSVYPNPGSEDFVTIDYELVKDSKVELLIVDGSGKGIAVQKNDFSTAKTGQFKVDVSRLPAGTYQCIIQTSYSRIAKQFVKI